MTERFCPSPMTTFITGTSPRPGTCAWCWGSPRCWASSASCPRLACFILASVVFHLDRADIQTLMYLKLSVAGHLTIFLTRTRGPFWSIRPARILWMAVLGTQIVATLIAVYGLFMTPLGWGWALFVWGYALVWFLVNDRVKLLAYRFLDPARAPLLARESLDLTPQLAVRASELYQQRVRSGSQADQDWREAEREIRQGEFRK